MSERPDPHALRLNAGRVRQAERNIEWILEHPAFSDWLKDTLRSGVRRDPLHLTNDLELLGHLLRAWADARLEHARLGEGD